MSVRLMTVFLWMLLAALPAFAQTETPTPTHTPDIYVFMTLPAPEVEGTDTPSPDQDVLFGYDLNAGDVGIMLFLALIFVALVGIFVTTLLFEKGK